MVWKSPLSFANLATTDKENRGGSRHPHPLRPLTSTAEPMLSYSDLQTDKINNGTYIDPESGDQGGWLTTDSGTYSPSSNLQYSNKDQAVTLPTGTLSSTTTDSATPTRAPVNTRTPPQELTRPGTTRPWRHGIQFCLLLRTERVERSVQATESSTSLAIGRLASYLLRSASTTGTSSSTGTLALG